MSRVIKELKIGGIIFGVGFFVYPGLEQLFGFFVNLVIVPILAYFGIVSHFPTGKSFAANVAIGIMGGVALYALGLINNIFKSWTKLQQYTLAYFVAVGIEWISGRIINIGIGLNAWGYSWLPLSSPDGQINFFFSLIWLAIMPLAFYLDDETRKRFKDI